MKITTILLITIIGASLLFVSCSRNAKTNLGDKTKRFALSEEVSLGIDEEATTNDGQITLKPLGVKDSRCPKGVQCMRAGEVFVDLWVKSGDKEEKLKMATPTNKRMGGFDTVTFEGHTIKLVNVTPYPVQPKPAEVAETAVILVVERAR